MGADGVEGGGGHDWRIGGDWGEERREDVMIPTMYSNLVSVGGGRKRPLVSYKPHFLFYSLCCMGYRGLGV